MNKLISDNSEHNCVKTILFFLNYLSYFFTNFFLGNFTIISHDSFVKLFIS